MDTKHEPPPPSTMHKVRTGLEHVKTKLRSEKVRIAFFFVLYWSSLIAVVVTIVVWAVMLSSVSTRSAFYGIIIPHLDLPTGLPYYKYSWLIEETDVPNEALVSLVPLPKSAYTVDASLWDGDYIAGKPAARGSSFGLFKQATAHLSAAFTEVAHGQLSSCSHHCEVNSPTIRTEWLAAPRLEADKVQTTVRLKFETFTLDLEYLNFKLVLSTAKEATMKMNAFTTFIRAGDDKATYEPKLDQVAMLQQMVDTIEDKVVSPSPNPGTCTVIPPSLESSPPPGVIPHPTDCPWDHEAYAEGTSRQCTASEARLNM